MIKLGQIVDERYEILKEIDRGGMSIVYLASDNRLKKSVALKDIRKSNKIDSRVLLNCLKAEVNLLKGLDHPNLPNVYDIIEGDDHIYVIMDYIEGESLKKKIEREKVISHEEVIDYAIQLSSVLDYLHTRKGNPIIYRDMKPDNIMLTPEGRIKLIDFGISIKSDEESSALSFATNLYASPEQLLRKKTDCRTDIYSLGVTLYYLVTGINKKVNPSLPPIRTINPSLPEGLERIISKCIQENPEDRYESCEKLLYDLENIEKLTSDYKKNVVKRIAPFLISTTLFIASLSVTLVGLNGIKSTNLDNYKAILNEASSNLVDGNNSKAIELLDKAITEVDSSRAEAYVNLLDIYINMGNTKEGIAKIESYINDKYGRVDKNNEVLFKLGMTYLDNNNYPSALKYFQKVDKKRIPDVKYYRTLATSMSNMNIDYEQFSAELEAFETFVDTLPNDEKKIINYNSLANIYGSYKGQIVNANDKIIDIINKADKVLENLEDNQLEIKYEVEFCQKLAQAYHSKGSNSEDKQQGKAYFNTAVDLYNELLDLEVKNTENILIKIGDIYYETQEYQSAIEYYNNTIKKYPESIKAYSKIINLLLDVEQAKTEGRSYDLIKNYYNSVSAISAANDNEDFKKLKRRIINLEIL